MKKFAVFDIDGTLIRWQLYHVIVDRLASNKNLSPDAKRKLKEARMVWKRRESTDSFAQYESSLIEIFESSLQSLNPSNFDMLIDSVIQEYREQTYRYTRELIKDLKAKGYFLIAISGSHHELVEEIARYYGFDDWIGTKYERVDNKFSGSKKVASHYKREHLEDFVKKYGLTYKSSYAIGDSASDIPMLELVENPIAFNPNRELMNKAKEKDWKIIVERKNVIYVLEPIDGKYYLI